MKKISEIYNITINESVVTEEMKSIEALPDTVALFITEFSKGAVFSLYDYKKHKVYGMMNILDSNTEGVYYVSAVAALKGFGPLMYELVMMHLGKHGVALQPDISGGVKDEAMNVWVKFFQRNDVKKETIPPEDYSFSYTILGDLHPSDPDYKELDFDEKMRQWGDLEGAFGVDQKKGELILLAFNTYYWMVPNDSYYTLVSRAKNAIKNGFNPEVAFDDSTDFWGVRY